MLNLARNRSRRFWIPAALVAVALIAASSALAYFVATSSPASHGASAATSVNAGPTPSASLTAGSGRSVTVSWGATTLSSGAAVGGYLVNRYDATSGVPQPSLIGCSGVITSLSCADIGVPPGSWKYSVTPVIGDNWQGAAGPLSGAVTVAPASLTLNQSLFGAPLPQSASGNVSGFADSEGLAFRLDSGPGTTLAGSPSVVDSSGAAAVNITVPSTSDGAHTVYALGDSSPYPSQASTGIVVDTTAPVTTAVLTPLAGGLGWNNADTTVSLAANDGSGSGVKQISFSASGAQTDALRTFPGASASYTVNTEGTTTVSFYATDNAGNTELTKTVTVKLDKSKPTNTLSLTAQSGAGSYLSSSTLYYHGAAAGSFSLSNALSDALSGPASSGTAALSGDTSGWSHTSSLVTAGPPYVSNAFSWSAATTSSPQETVTGTDVAGNNDLSTLSFVDDESAPTGGALSIDGQYAATGDPFGGYPDNGTFYIYRTDYNADAGAGVASSVLTVQTAALSSSDGLAAGTCGSFGSATVITGGWATVSGSYCYRYTLTGTDNVGNQTSISETLGVDTTPASVPALTLSGSGPSEYVTGATVYYNPQGSNSGTFTLAATTTDPDSGIKYVDPPTLSGMSGGDPMFTSPFQTTYDWTSSSTASGPQPVYAANNTGQESTESYFTVTPDTTAPTGGTLSANGTDATAAGSSVYSNSGTFAFAYQRYYVDAGSGLASSTLTMETAPLVSSDGIADGHCGSFGTAMTIISAPPSWTEPGPHCYRYTLTGTDNVGNVASISVTVKVDTSAPSFLSAAALTPQTGLAYQYVSGSTLYYNPTQAGSFNIDSPTNDLDSGIGLVTGPFLGGYGFTGSGVASYVGGSDFRLNYAWNNMGAAGPSPGARDIRSQNNAGGVAIANSAFTLTKDSDGPSGGSLYVSGLPATSAGSSFFTRVNTLSIIRQDYNVDSGSGVASSILTVQSAPLSSSDGIAAGTCGNFGATTVITGSADQPAASPACYHYTLTGTDNVGNQTSVSTTIMVDTTDPSTPVVTVSNATGNTFINGSTVYYSPQPWSSGSFKVTSQATDPDSGIGWMQYPGLAGFSGGGGAVSSSPYSVTYSWSGTSATESGVETIMAINNSHLNTNNTSAFTVTPDTTKPTAPTPAVVGGYYNTLSVPVGVPSVTDSGSGVAQVLVQRLEMPLVNNVCGSIVGSWVTVTLVGGADTTVQSGHCYYWRLATIDNVGNQAVSAYASSLAKVDNSAPDMPTLSFGSFSNSYWPGSGNIVYYRPAASSGSFTASGFASDAESGIQSYSFPTFPLDWTSTWLGSGEIYGWSAPNPTQPSGNQSVTATNHAGLTSSGSNSTNPFLAVPDSSVPVVPQPPVTAGYFTSLSVPILLVTVTDTGSGVDASTVALQRDQATLVDGVCGGFPGTWATTVTLSGGADTSVSSGFCYRYREIASDNVGNQGVSAVSATAMVDAVAPTGSLTAPAAGTIGGIVTVSADSADTGGSGVASAVLQFAPHGTVAAFFDLATVTTSPYQASWDTTAVINGDYDLRVRTTDRAGNTFTSPVVSVTVSNTLQASFSSPQTAGTAFTVTLTALAAGATNTGYNATVPVTFTGPGTIGTHSPSYPTNVTFTNGVGTASVTLYKAETTTLSATTGNLVAANAPALTVNLNPSSVTVTLSHCAINGTSTSCSGSPFALGNSGTFSGQFDASADSYGNTVSTLGLSLSSATVFSFSLPSALSSISVAPSASFSVFKRTTANPPPVTVTAQVSGTTKASFQVKK